jgi:hypothetical protein
MVKLWVSKTAKRQFSEGMFGVEYSMKNDRGQSGLKAISKRNIVNKWHSNP